ncbi:MAG: DUF305 domain-containing protein [Alsobacter sp.]
MFNRISRFCFIAAALIAPGAAFAQSATTPASPASEQAMKILPDACKKAAQGSSMGQMMQTSGMGQGTMSSDSMPAVNQAYMDAMRDMNPPMMLGMSIADPNLVFVCSMIPHHQGAIDMAKAALKSAKDAEVRKMAERTIKEQEKEIEEMSRMAAKLAK